MDLVTCFVGSILWVAYTLALVVEDVFKPGTDWQMAMHIVTKTTKNFNNNPKGKLLLQRTQRDEGMTKNLLQSLKTRHLNPQAFETFCHVRISYKDNIIETIASKRNIPNSGLPRMSLEQQILLAEFFTVLSEVRRVARQFEADRKVEMSRASRLLRELYANNA